MPDQRHKIEGIRKDEKSHCVIIRFIDLLTCVIHTAHVIDIGCPSVRLSVCPSHAGIVSKRLNQSTYRQTDFTAW